MLPAAVTLEGLVTSSNWTALLVRAATAAYVRLSDSNMATERGSSSFALLLFVMLPAAVTLEGLVTSSNWTALLVRAATAAYVRLSDSNMATERGSSSFALLLFVMLPAAVTLEGLVMSSIWTPSSWLAVTAAYVRPPV